MFVPMDATAQGFMLAESRNTPMHVGGLQLFDPPEGAEPDWVRRMYDRAVEQPAVSPLYLKRPVRSVKTGGAYVWEEDDAFDLEYHARHSALAAPGRPRDLLELIGRLHGTPMALERPLWETNFIEGLDDGRVAIYTKLHHALVDGVSAVRLMQATLSTDPDEETAPPWAQRPTKVTEALEKEQADLAARLTEVPLAAVRSALAISSEAAGMPLALLRTLNRSIRNETAPISLYAPRTILNQEITGARRFAAQHWAIDRIKQVGKATGTTVNDVVLAMCSGALRQYLLDLRALPDRSLIAMVPVSLRLEDAQKASAEGGNATGTIMVRLATDEDDPARRLEAIHASVDSGKQALSSMSPLQVLAMSGLGLSTMVLLPMMRMQGLTRPPFNVVISNVPGPRRTLYLSGSRLSGIYPLSIPFHGQALNITCESYEGQMNFGLTGCRRTVPSLQRILSHLDAEMIALEKVAGVA
jgi:diacylglycerol O-acyltransferase